MQHSAVRLLQKSTSGSGSKIKLQFRFRST